MLAEGPWVRVGDVQLDTRARPAPAPEARPTPRPQPSPADAVVERTLDEVEREHVARVLAATGGNKSRAAEILGVSRNALYRLIARHGL